MLSVNAIVTFVIISAVAVISTAPESKLTFKTDGTFKILHISDVHYEVPVSTCSDILPSQRPCSQANSTAFLAWLIETEAPDLVVHTGDIIDWGTYPATEGMSEYYGVSYAHNVPWAASLGNHDDDSPTMTNRSKVMDYVINLPGSLSSVGPVEGTYGNFILEIYPSEDATSPAFRTYHFDSDTNGEAITAAQVSWYVEQSEALNAVAPAPALAFYHIPLEEYYIATSSGIPYSGGYNEYICYESTNEGLFDAFKNHDVKAGFCGHDHTNDFCVPYEGVNLCYEGSPGFTAYGSAGYARRARVTEIRDFGAEVVSWKRLDTSIGGGAIDDVETLYSADSMKPGIQAVRRVIDKATINSLPKRSQEKKQ